MLTAAILWVFIADYRATRPGIGLVNIVVTLLLLLGWMATRTHTLEWLNPLLAALLGINGVLVGWKNLRVAESRLPLWLAIGILGVGWLVGAVMSLGMMLWGSWEWLTGTGRYLWLVGRFALLLPGLLPLVRLFFGRQPVEWPAGALMLSLRVAGIVAGFDAVFFLLELVSMSGGLDGSMETWRVSVPAVLQSIALAMLETIVIMLAVKWWLTRQPAAV